MNALEELKAALQEAKTEAATLRIRVAQLEGAVRWACGEIPADDGKWFGEVEDAEQTTRGMPSTRRRYWWRRRLRLMAFPLAAADTAATRQPGAQAAFPSTVSGDE